MINVTSQIAKQLRDVHHGGNWTAVNLKDVVADITWQQAVSKVSSFNTIAALVYHMHYYVGAVLKVLQGGALDASDKYSFGHPPINSMGDWENLLQTTWKDADSLGDLIEQLPESKLWETFVDEKYGNYYRNLQGIIEHTHYHLGQIVLIKKALS